MKRITSLLSSLFTACALCLLTVGLVATANVARADEDLSGGCVDQSNQCADAGNPAACEGTNCSCRDQDPNCPGYYLDIPCCLNLIDGY